MDFCNFLQLTFTLLTLVTSGATGPTVVDKPSVFADPHIISLSRRVPRAGLGHIRATLETAPLLVEVQGVAPCNFITIRRTQLGSCILWAVRGMSPLGTIDVRALQWWRRARPHLGPSTQAFAWCCIAVIVRRDVMAGERVQSTRGGGAKALCARQ